MLAESGVISSLKACLLDHFVPIRKKRASLWGIGFIGASEKSFDLLEGTQLVSIIVDLAENSPHLSLRGTACYIINMISGSEKGRRKIEELNWSVYDISSKGKSVYLDGRVCLPKEKRHFFAISDFDSKTNHVFFQNQMDLWGKYSKALSLKEGEDPKTPQKRLIACITEMCFLMSSKPQEEISRICLENKEIFGDPVLMHQLVTVLSFTRFRSSKARAFLFSLLDKFLQDQSFSLWGLSYQTTPKSESPQKEQKEGGQSPTHFRSLSGSDFDLI